MYGRLCCNIGSLLFSLCLQVDVVVVGADISSLASQRYFEDIAASVNSSLSFYPFVISWYSSLCHYAVECNRTLPGEPVPATDFIPLLLEFFNTSIGRSFKHDVVFERLDDGRVHVEAVRLVAWQKSAVDTDLLLERMANAQTITQDPPPGLSAHSYSFIYRFLHQVSDVRRTGYQVVVISLAVVMVITWFFFEGSFVGAFLCTMLIAVVNLNLFGFMHVLGVEYNHASHTVLVIGIGFSVDYIAHLILAFARTKGERIPC